MAEYPNPTHLKLSITHAKWAFSLFAGLCWLGLPVDWAAVLYVKLFVRIRVIGLAHG